MGGNAQRTDGPCVCCVLCVAQEPILDIKFSPDGQSASLDAPSALLQKAEH
jgi:hypothetical protein